MESQSITSFNRAERYRKIGCDGSQKVHKALPCLQNLEPSQLPVTGLNPELPARKVPESTDNISRMMVKKRRKNCLVVQ